MLPTDSLSAIRAISTVDSPTPRKTFLNDALPLSKVVPPLSQLLLEPLP